MVWVCNVKTGPAGGPAQGRFSLGVPVFSPDGSRIIVGNSTWHPSEGPVRPSDGAVRMYDSRTVQEVLTLEGPFQTPPASVRTGRASLGWGTPEDGEY